MRRIARGIFPNPMFVFNAHNPYGYELSCLSIEGAGDFRELSTRFKSGSRPLCGANTIPE